MPHQDDTSSVERQILASSLPRTRTRVVVLSIAGAAALVAPLAWLIYRYVSTAHVSGTEHRIELVARGDCKSASVHVVVSGERRAEAGSRSTFRTRSGGS